jgi:hypothetical protein
MLDNKFGIAIIEFALYYTINLAELKESNEY